MMVCLYDCEIGRFVPLALIFHDHFPNLIEQLGPKIIQSIPHSLIALIIPHHHIRSINPVQFCFLRLYGLTGWKMMERSFQNLINLSIHNPIHKLEMY